MAIEIANDDSSSKAVGWVQTYPITLGEITTLLYGRNHEVTMVLSYMKCWGTATWIPLAVVRWRCWGSTCFWWPFIDNPSDTINRFADSCHKSRGITIPCYWMLLSISVTSSGCYYPAWPSLGSSDSASVWVLLTTAYSESSKHALPDQELETQTCWQSRSIAIHSWSRFFVRPSTIPGNWGFLPSTAL